MLPKIIFDTSGINALEDGGVNSAPLMRRLAWEFEVILTGISFEELISTPRIKEREALIRRFQRLLRPGKCIVPSNEILQLMISSHDKSPTQFDWTMVDVRMPPSREDMIARRDWRDCLDDTACADQLIEQRQMERCFKQLLKSVRPPLDAIPTEERPGSFGEFLATDEADGQFRWKIGRGIYRRVSGKRLTEPEITDFVMRCPPFRALCLGQAMGFYHWSLRGQRGRKDPAGRNDLMMAGYLPYCGFFVTKDCFQREALREVADRAEIACQGLSFDEFARSV